MNGAVPVVKAVGLTRCFRGRDGRGFVAVRGVSLRVDPGETVALVGESGAGKSTLGRMLVGLDVPTDGRLFWNGHPAERFRGRSARAERRHRQYLFQDARSSLNPRWTVDRILGEAWDLSGRPGTCARACARDINGMLARVGLEPGCRGFRPEQLSGGEAQRVALARALAVSPELIVLDEPFGALDMVTAAVMTNLLLDEQERNRIALVLITHDLGRVGHLADRIAVMRAGEIVEIAPAPRLFASPSHPYTRTLLEAVPGRKLDLALKDRKPAFDPA